MKTKERNILLKIYPEKELKKFEKQEIDEFSIQGFTMERLIFILDKDVSDELQKIKSNEKYFLFGGLYIFYFKQKAGIRYGIGYDRNKTAGLVPEHLW